jgi:hypothetical protein
MSSAVGDDGQGPGRGGARPRRYAVRPADIAVSPAPSIGLSTEPLWHEGHHLRDITPTQEGETRVLFASFGTDLVELLLNLWRAAHQPSTSGFTGVAVSMLWNDVHGSILFGVIERPVGRCKRVYAIEAFRIPSAVKNEWDFVLHPCCTEQTSLHVTPCNRTYCTEHTESVPRRGNRRENEARTSKKCPCLFGFLRRKSWRSRDDSNIRPTV